MFSIKNVPVVIEPGVGALESELYVSEGPGAGRSFPVQMQRISLDEFSAQQLPFIACTLEPHVFSLIPDLKKSSIIVTYDFLGRIASVYTRGGHEKAWEKHEVAAEHAGKTITQFAVRFSFEAAKERARFLALVVKITEQIRAKQKPTSADMFAAFTLLARSKTSPVVLPLAIARGKVSDAVL